MTGMSAHGPQPSSSPFPGDHRSGRSVRAWVILLTMLLGGLAIDLTTKSWAFENVGPHPVDIRALGGRVDSVLRDIPPIEVVPRVLNLHLVLNRGAVFGIGPGRRWFFVVFSIVAVVVGVYVFAYRTRSNHTMTHVAIGSILAGALGNLIDRLIFAAVRDFLNLFPQIPMPFGWRWPGGSPDLFPWVFNVADMLLLLGVGLVILRMHSMELEHRAAVAKRKEEVSGARADAAG